MGKYVNKGNLDFTEARNLEYVDKSGLIAFVNKTLSTPDKMTCVSRARRFGKSLALQMLYAYYDCSCDSHHLFDDLSISRDASYETHINKYLTVHLDMTAFITGASSPDRIIDEMIARVIADIKSEFPDVKYSQWNNLMDVMLDVATDTGKRFVMLIDEWDALCREASDRPDLLRQYINLLRNLFKSDNTNRVFAGVYMTGILPIKNYGTQSALNNFRMFSMTNPEPIEPFFGFTADEVEKLCSVHNIDFLELSHWYNGYKLGSNAVRIFNPTSVMTVLTTGVCKGYWAITESFESVKDLINMNFDGVKESLESMLAEQPTKVTVSTFGNDSNVIGSKDELFTLLIHYGYLGYDAVNQKTFIPNSEVRQELLQAIKNGNRPELVKMINDSEELLRRTLEGDCDYVAESLNALHASKIAPSFFNNEQALRSLIHFAYIAAVDDYVQIQELPSGNGYADVVFIPRKGSERPAMVVELKCNGCAAGAIEQIKNRKYPTVVAEFTDDILLIGVNYDKKSKHHECKIERWNKTKGVLPIAKPAISRSNPEDSRSNPEDSRSNPEISRSNPEDSRSNPEISRSNPEDSRSNPEISRSNPEDSRSNPEISRSNPEISRSNPEDSRSNPEISRSNPEDSRSNPEISRSNSEISRSNPEDSRSNPEDSRSNSEISRSNPKISRSNIENLIAEFCSEPKTLEEIATHLGLKDKYYMKKRYINPILGIRLRMTEPDSPNSPTQKYIAL